MTKEGIRRRVLTQQLILKVEETREHNDLLSGVNTEIFINLNLI